MSQPRPNADQVRSCSARQRGLVSAGDGNSAVRGVCLGASSPIRRVVSHRLQSAESSHTHGDPKPRWIDASHTWSHVLCWCPKAAIV